MQSRHSSIISRTSKDHFDILTCPTHERYQGNWSTMPHHFWMLHGPGIKTWNFDQSPVPQNHDILKSIPNHVVVDIVLSQSRASQFKILHKVATEFNIPLINLEHTLPVPTWNSKTLKAIAALRGDINIYISEYSAKAWGESLDDLKVRIIKHGVDTDFWKSTDQERSNDVLTVVNDYKNRDWCCGWSIYQDVIQEFKARPRGNTPGLSEPSNEKQLLVDYNTCGVFLNTSTYSPIPTALLEAMACGCPVVSTATCEIPNIIKTGVNGFCSNKNDDLKDYINYLLDNPDKAKEMGEKARQTILEDFSLTKHIENWMNLFKEVAYL
jgi:glycosyltransferase involved in cell wall biosynthesis